MLNFCSLMFPGIVNCYLRKTYFPNVLYGGYIGFGLLSSKRGTHNIKYNIYIHLVLYSTIGKRVILISI